MESITRVGIDAASGWLDLLIDLPQSRRRRYGNTAEGVTELVEELGPAPCLVALEASGRYEGLVRHALEAAGHTVKVRNPRRARQLASGLGIQAKTDLIDAKFLAETADLGGISESRSKEREVLGDLSRTIECLKKERSGHLKRMQVPGFCPAACASLKKIVQALDGELKRLEKLFVQKANKSKFALAYKVCLSVGGVGPVLGRVAVCELPEDIHKWSIRQISSYAGVAPMDRSSGKRVLDARVSHHCNTHLKAALYMPAMALVARDGWAKQLYQRLRQKGRTHQQAAVAVMHKLLIHIVAVLKRGSPWQDEPPKRG